jgi:hypothetical protein
VSGLFAEGDNPEKSWECGPIFELKLNHGRGLTQPCRTAEAIGYISIYSFTEESSAHGK